MILIRTENVTSYLRMIESRIRSKTDIIKMKSYYKTYNALHNGGCMRVELITTGHEPVALPIKLTSTNY